jgi:hypothetical protein
MLLKNNHLFNFLLSISIGSAQQLVEEIQFMIALDAWNILNNKPSYWFSIFNFIQFYRTTCAVSLKKVSIPKSITIMFH